MTQRTDRIDELLRQEIGDLLATEVADPAIGFVTVTRVATSPDLAHARVWVSLIGQRAERSASLAALRRAMPFVRHRLNERVRLRRIPDLHVVVNAVDDAPLAIDDVAATDEDVALQLSASSLLANDTDIEGDALVVTAVGPATDRSEEHTSELQSH